MVSGSNFWNGAVLLSLSNQKYSQYHGQMCHYGVSATKAPRVGDQIACAWTLQWAARFRGSLVTSQFASPVSVVSFVKCRIGVDSSAHQSSTVAPKKFSVS